VRPPPPSRQFMRPSGSMDTTTAAAARGSDIYDAGVSVATTQDVLESLGLPPGASGVLPSQAIERAIALGWIGGDRKIPPENVQPASLDLRLGETVHRIRASFLPDRRPIAEKLREFSQDSFSIHEEPRILEPGTPYLISLQEELALPAGIRGKANPKSSTGRLDVFTRVITDRGRRFDQVQDGYVGPLFLEVVPLSFTVKIHEGLTLNQLRLSVGRSSIHDEELLQIHETDPLLYERGVAVPAPKLSFSDGLFLSLDLSHQHVGYQAKKHRRALDLGRGQPYDWKEFWDPVESEEGDTIVLDPNAFYLLLSNESVRIPPGLAAEMAAYDPTSGELRTHYAGFFDPGFGYDPAGALRGSRAALEVRAHDVPFAIEHGQKVAKLTYERMAAEPETLYGAGIGSSYQGQTDTLGKHFTRPSEDGGARPDDDQLDLFG